MNNLTRLNIKVNIAILLGVIAIFGAMMRSYQVTFDKDQIENQMSELSTDVMVLKSTPSQKCDMDGYLKRVDVMPAVIIR